MFGFGKSDTSSLWENYRDRLAAAVSRAKLTTAAPGSAGSFDPEIETALNAAKVNNWNQLYAVEQRLLRFTAAEDVTAEFIRRAHEAELLKVDSVATLKSYFDRTEPSEEVLRQSYLRCLLEDLHFRYIKRTLDRDTRRGTISSYIASGLALTVVFAALLIWGANSDAIPDKKVLNVVLVMLIGLCGAYFSRLTALNSNVDIDYDTLMSSYRFKSLLLRGGIGMLAAVVVYYLIYSGLISGDLFPAPESIKSIVSMFDKGSPMVPVKDTAKLMVWCFIAGFSERFVTGTLERLEKTDTSKQ